MNWKITIIRFNPLSQVPNHIISYLKSKDAWPILSILIYFLFMIKGISSFKGVLFGKYQFINNFLL